MHAQVIEGGTTPRLRTRMDQIVTDELIPALRAEPGFAGALNLVDRDSGNAIMIIFWDTHGQARRELSAYRPAFLQALAEITTITTGNGRPISHWEVNACDVPATAATALVTGEFPR